MSKRIIYFLTIVFSLSLMTFTACSSDDDDPAKANLTLEKGEVSVEVGKTVTVKITEGNGGYTLTPASAEIATATEENNTITITGVGEGETTVAVKDKEGKTASITVTVTDLATDIIGTYNGELNVKVGPLPGIPVLGQDIKVIRSGTNKIKLVIENFTFLAQNVGNIEIDNITLTEDGEIIKLADTTADIVLAEGGIKGVAAVSEATIEDGTLAMKIDVTEVEMADEEGEFTSLGMDIAISFTGEIVEEPAE